MATQPERESASPTGGTATIELSPAERTKLEEEAKTLQDGLTALLERIDSVKEEYDKLQTENKLLQEWIGNSIQRNAQAKPRS